MCKAHSKVTHIKGATENAGLELNGPTKFGGWKMQDWN